MAPSATTSTSHNGPTPVVAPLPPRPDSPDQVEEKEAEDDWEAPAPPARMTMPKEVEHVETAKVEEDGEEVRVRFLSVIENFS